MAVYGALISVIEQTPAMLVMTVDENSGSVPIARPDGSQLQDGDYCKVKQTANVPFTITGTGGPFTITTKNDVLSFSKNEMRWYLNPSNTTKTKDVEVVSKDTESISKSAETQQAINTENVNRLNEVLKEAKFEIADNKLTLQLTQYKEVSPATTPASYVDLIKKDLDVDERATENNKTHFISSDSLWKELLKTSMCKFEYSMDKIHLYLRNNADEVVFDVYLDISHEATQDEEKVITSDAVWDELIKITDDKFEIASNKLTLEFKNNKGTTLFSKELTIDSVATKDSTNLIDSNAVWKETIDTTKNKFEVNTTTNKLDLQVVNNTGNDVFNKNVDVDAEATIGNTTHLITSDAVGKAQIDADASTFTIDKTDATKDTLNITLKDHLAKLLLDKTIDLEDKLTFKTNTQELSNKTLDFDENSATKNIATNIPLSSIAKQTSADAKKILKVNETDYAIDLSFLDIIKEVDTIPTTKDDEDILLKKTGEKKLYFWNTDKSVYQAIGGGGIVKVDSFPTTEIDDEVIYLMEKIDTTQTPTATYIQLWVHYTGTSGWYMIYTDEYGAILYEKAEQEVKNKTIKAEEQKELDLFVEVDALPTADAKKCLYYDTVNQEVKFSRDGGTSWSSLAGDAFEKVTALPTTNIRKHFYLLDTQTILLGRYSVINTSTMGVNSKGIVIDGSLHSNKEIITNWEDYRNLLIEDPKGELKLYTYAYKNDKFLTTENADEVDGMYYYNHRSTTWIRIDRPALNETQLEYDSTNDEKLSFKKKTLTEKDCVWNVTADGSWQLTQLELKQIKKYDVSKAGKTVKILADGTIGIEADEAQISIATTPTTVTSGVATRLTVAGNITLDPSVTLTSAKIYFNGVFKKEVTISSYGGAYSEQITVNEAGWVKVTVHRQDGSENSETYYVGETPQTATSYIGTVSTGTTAITDVTSRSYYKRMSITNDRIVYKYLANFGELTSISINGDECLSVFTKTGADGYYTYTQNSNMTGVFDVSFN